MAVEIRACADHDELQQYYRVGAYVFANNDGFEANEVATAPDWTTCAFEDGNIVSTLGAFPFTMRYNGVPIQAGGVTMVGTLPGHRRRGYLRQTMAEAFRLMKERQQPLAILWASMGAIYQRFGYGICSDQVSYRFDPRYAGLQEPRSVPGAISLETPEDAFATIKRLYIEYATPRNLMLHRAPAMWQAGTLRPAKKGEPVYVAIYRNEAGEPRGYIVYQTHEQERLEPGPGHTLTVKDFIALDLDAYRALWEYIRAHDLVGTVHIWGAIGVEDPAPDLLLEPRMLNKKVQDGIWGRVVDIVPALTGRPYGDDGQLVVDLPSDDMCEWNAGRYLLRVEGGEAAVEATTRQPDLTVTAQALASLLMGARTATQLHRVGRLVAADDAVLTRADRMFRTAYAPHCPNGF